VLVVEGAQIPSLPLVRAAASSRDSFPLGSAAEGEVAC